MPERFAGYDRRLTGRRALGPVLRARCLPTCVAARERRSSPRSTEPLACSSSVGLCRAAFFVGLSVDAAPEPPPGGGREAEVRYEPVDAHTARIRARTPRGFVVVLDGYHPDWTAEDESGPGPGPACQRPVSCHPDRRAGDHVFTFRYRPRWRVPARARRLGDRAVGVAPRR